MTLEQNRIEDMYHEIKKTNLSHIVIIKILAAFITSEDLSLYRREGALSLENFVINL
jgi:hypothetical protein